ncbi:MAG: IclR family transcriptional regulator [Desulfobacterota bacterium]|nr:IclR family transcriptional regulator [Thermodesulfobacteriota bacterium]MDW8001198.1 IclR family transcriptional regulator [Deltaproteobacteria bacterium]
MYRAPLVRKVFDVLEVLLEDNNDLRLSYLAKKTGLNRGTLYGILLALEDKGYIRKDKERKTYHISARLVDLAKKILRKSNLSGIARPFLERLSKKFDETVFLGVRNGDYIEILDAVEPLKPYKISSPPGTKLPLTAGATGKVVLSFSTDEEVRAIIRKKGLKKYTERSVSDETEFLEEVRRARMLGYSMEVEEYMRGVWACAAPIFSERRSLGVIWIVGFTSFFREEMKEEIIKEVKRTAELIALAYETFWRKEGNDHG